MSVEEFTADLKAELAKPGVTRVVRWALVTEGQCRRRYGRHRCGTPLAAVTIATLSEAGRLCVNYRPACPTCHGYTAPAA